MIVTKFKREPIQQFQTENNSDQKVWQLSERLASVGIRAAQLRDHHSTIVLRDLRGSLIIPHYADRCQSHRQQI